MGRYDRKLVEELARINGLRLSGSLEASVRLEGRLRAARDASRRLATYGSLRPGEVNHGVVAGLGGVWEPALVLGTVDPSGWGRTDGFPALRWSAEGRPVEVRLLTSPALPSAWERIDRFEGTAYVRTLVPVDTAEGVVVANLYELRPRPAPGRQTAIRP